MPNHRTTDAQFTTLVKSSWITKRTLIAIRKRNKAWKRYAASPCDRCYTEYKRLRNKANNLVKEDKQMYSGKIVKSFQKSPKRFYGYGRGLQTSNVQVSQLLTPDGSLTTNDEESASVLCQTFKDVFTAEENFSPPFDAQESSSIVTVRCVRVVLAAEQILLFSGGATSRVYGSNDNRGLIQYLHFYLQKNVQTRATSTSTCYVFTRPSLSAE